MAFVADMYHHVFVGFTGTIDLSLPTFNFDPSVLWEGAWGDFVNMWDVARLAPDELLTISKTMTSASFGFVLSKMLMSLSAAAFVSFLQVFPDQ